MYFPKAKSEMRKKRKNRESFLPLLFGLWDMGRKEQNERGGSS